jgi:hypothetical protein
MRNLRLFLLPFLVTVISLPVWAARELVDNFDGSSIDFSKWSNFDPAFSAHEFFARIDTGNENLVLMDASDGSRYQRTRISVPSTTLTAMQATISVIAVADGGSRASANVEGRYYNAVSAAPTDAIGDVFAAVSIGDRGNGLEAWWEIVQATAPDFTAWIQVSSGTIIAPGTLSTGSAYVTKIEYDGDRTFTFDVAGTSSGSVTGPARVGFPASSSQRLSASTDCCGTNPSIKATFDDIYLDNNLTVYDDFSSGPYLDRSKWQQYSGAVILSRRVDPAVTGKLFMFVSDENLIDGGRSSSDLYLKERNPDRIEARVSISSDSQLDPGLRGRARLNGYAYNERRDGGADALPYDGCDGDVWVQVEIDLKDGGLYATAFAGPETSGCDTEKTLISETFTKLLEFDTEYLLWIERDGEKLMLGLDAEVYEHTITTPIYPPSPSAGNGFRRLSARIQGTSTSDPTGADGVFEMLVDDVYVGIDGGDGDGDGDGDGGCFIATAAYGSYLDPHVITLRNFRDKYMLTNSIGKKFVEYYYRHSPPIADYVRERETLKTMVRYALTFVVYSIEYPVVAGFVLLLPPLIVVRQRKRRKNRNS